MHKRMPRFAYTASIWSLLAVFFDACWSFQPVIIKNIVIESKKYPSSCFTTRLKVSSNEIKNKNIDVDWSDKSPLQPDEEDYLDALFKEALFRMSFFMETDYLHRVENDELQNLFRNCIDSVYINQSTIPQAGRGLFARRNIPKGTIIAFYPVDSIGIKFESGLCSSVQLARDQDEMIDVQSSSYALFSLANRELCGVDIQKDFHNGRLFVDMNPMKNFKEGWYCGLINDAAIVRYQGDLEYYPNSRSRQNVEIVPFSTAPFQVGVTRKDVKADDELFVSYGYNYWVNKLLLVDDNGDDGDKWQTKPLEVEEQERQAMYEMFAAVECVEERYKEASWILSQIFNGMNSDEPPSLVPPIFESVELSKKDNRLLSSFIQKLQQFFQKG